MIQKMKIKLKKIMVLILLCILVFNFLPISIFAEEIKEANEKRILDNPIESLEEIETPIKETTNEEKPEVIGEDIERRTLNEKHFLLEDR